MKTGVLIVGARGATAHTTIASARMCTREQLAPFLISADFENLSLPDPSQIVWGGWDVMEESWPQTVRRHGVLDPRLHAVDDVLADVPVFEALVLDRDHAVVAEGRRRSCAPGDEAVAKVRDDIRTFSERFGVDHVVVVYLAAPSLLGARESWPQSAQEWREAIARGDFETAAPYYVTAAVEEGCGFVDYTASPTLEVPGLVAYASEHGVALAGRDGSTGQTLLKSVLAETFATRKLLVRGWYSANILGNHDGFMLQDPRYCDVKKVDKTALLDDIVGYNVDSHLVDIRYYTPAGDNKEAWDAIDFETLLGSRGELRINWRCSDSLLAAPAVIDLVRFMALARRTGTHGIQSQLGMFFKFALGTSERRYLHLARALADYCARIERIDGNSHQAAVSQVAEI